MKKDQLCRLAEVLAEEGYEIIDFKRNKSELSGAIDLIIAPDGSREEGAKIERAKNFPMAGCL
jgi:hypothetical protein